MQTQGQGTRTDPIYNKVKNTYHLPVAWKEKSATNSSYWGTRNTINSFLQPRKKSNKVKVTEKGWGKKKKKDAKTWMDAISVNLFDPLSSQMRMDGRDSRCPDWKMDECAAMALIDWRQEFSLAIIESWKSLKAQVQQIIRRANQVVINPRCESSLGDGRKKELVILQCWSFHGSRCKTPKPALCAHKGTFKRFEDASFSGDSDRIY